jgi:hypothetical protein
MTGRAKIARPAAVSSPGGSRSPDDDSYALCWKQYSA